MSARRVVGLGLCVLDEVLRVDDFDLSKTRTRHRERFRGPGGMAANACAHAAHAGVRSQLISWVGDDADGDFALRALRRHGVNTRGVVRSQTHPTTLAVVLVHAKTADRRFIVADRRGHERACPALPVSAVGHDSVLLVDGHFERSAARAIARARRLGTPVVGDFADARPAFLRLLPEVDYPIVPEEFIRAYGVGDAHATLRALADRFGGHPVITRGARGALALDGRRVRRIAAHEPDRVIDTTGAGDAFHGGFAAGLAQGLDFFEALELASRVAGACCAHLGGTGGLP